MSTFVAKMRNSGQSTCGQRRPLLSEAFKLPAVRAGTQPALLPLRLNCVTAAHAIRPVVGGVEWVSDAPGCRAGRLLARPPLITVRHDDSPLSAHCAGRCGNGLGGKLFARSPSAPARRSRGPPSSGRISLRRCWPPRGHDVGDRPCGLSSRLLERYGRAGCLLSREATVPRGRANILIMTLRPVSHSAAGSHMHHLDGPASRCASASENSQRLSPISRSWLVVLEAGEDVVFVVHVDPVSEVPVAELQFVDCNVGGGSTVCIN